MKEIIVEVYLAAAKKSYDIRIPLSGRMWEVTKLVSSALSELSDGLYKASEDSVLCDGNTGAIYNINYTIEELGIRNGSQLVLI